MTEPDLASPALPEAADWRASLERGALEEALGRLRALEAVGRGEPAVRTALEGWLALREALRAKDHPEARRRLGELEALGERPDLPVRTAGLAEALSDLEAADGGRADLRAARQHLTQALEHPVTRGEAANGLGVLEAGAERHDEARRFFEEALAADPRHYRAITNLGNLELEAGRLDAAVARYREAIALNAGYSGAHHNLAAALRRQGKRAESVAALKKAQRLSLGGQSGARGAGTGPGGPGRVGGLPSFGSWWQSQPRQIRFVVLFLIGALVYWFLRR